MDDADPQQAVQEDVQWKPRVDPHTPRHVVAEG